MLKGVSSDQLIDGFDPTRVLGEDLVLSQPADRASPAAASQVWKLHPEDLNPAL